jgi:hypothetical protein
MCNGFIILCTRVTRNGTCGRILSYYRCMRGCLVAHDMVYMEKPVFTTGVGQLTR